MSSRIRNILLRNGWNVGVGSKILETARIATSGASYALIKRDFNIPSLRPSEQPSAHSNMDPDGCWGKNRVSERALFCETRDRSKTASSDTSTLFRSLHPNMNIHTLCPAAEFIRGNILGLW